MTVVFLPRVFSNHRWSFRLPVLESARRWRLAAALAATGLMSAAALAATPSLLPGQPVPLDSLAEFRPKAGGWQIAGGLADQPRETKTLTPVPGTGVLVSVPRPDARDSLVTSWEHGDVSLQLEFLLPAGSNSGVYLQGRYEVQLFDSWGVRQPTAADCGGIYDRWDATRGAGREGFDGHAPLANACRAPGLWQQLQIDFQAPRFDATGRKIANAKFLKVTLNGYDIQKNVEVTGPTRSALFNDEKLLGPLMIQGDHGPVAIRRLRVKRYEAEPATLKDLALEFFTGDFDSLAEYEKNSPKREARVEGFGEGVTESDGRGAARFNGNLKVPTNGEYAFEARGTPAARLMIDGHAVFLPNEGGRHYGRITLSAGEHTLQMDLIRGSYRYLRNFELWVEGPGLAPQTLGGQRAERTSKRHEDGPTVDPTDHILTQRGFVPFEPYKRLYAVSVGTPAGVHYAYDLEAATVLRVWRGRFLDASELWVERAEPQLAKPNGPALTLSGKPLLAMFAEGGARWPDKAAQTAASQGYRIEADGQPVFFYNYVGVSVTDRIAPMPDGKGLTRTLHFTGKPWERSLWVLIAEGTTVKAQEGGFVIGDREFYVDWPAGAALQPAIRTESGQQQLVVHLPVDGAAHDVTYNLVW